MVFSFELALWQQKMSNLLASCLLISRVIRAMKAVIWRMKSTNKAIPAYRAKAFTAGIPDKAPRKKQADSVMELSNIEGATSPTILAI